MAYERTKISPEWKEQVLNKRSHLAAQIPKEWRVSEAVAAKVSPKSSISAFDLLKESSLLTPREMEITEKYDATALLDQLRSKTITSVEVTTAFCKRAAIAHQLTNCLTEIFFEKALERAKYLDDYLTREGKTVGPFHGLPVSLKDMLMVEGEYATLGFISYLKKPRAIENSFIVDQLLDAGAVLYVKTNVPQTLFVCEGFNNLFGQTMNPHKLSLTPAGSSSGEGALVGLRGSVMGVGSDIGGSIRAPSLCCGAFGFKPTADRVPWGKQQELIPKGWPSVVPTLGPHAQSARDLTLFFKTIIQDKPWLRDSTAQAVAWRDVPKKKVLTIGVVLSDSFMPVHPPVARILAAAVEKLRTAGHEVKVLEKFPSLGDACSITVRSLNLDTEHQVRAFVHQGGEEVIPEVTFDPAPLAEGELPIKVDLKEVWNVNALKEDYREEWGAVWRTQGLDVLLYPGARGTAPPHTKYGIPAYTLIWNLLDFPSSVIPFLKADKSVDSAAAEGYDAEAVDGAPGSVQVVGWRFQDEEVLMATEVIADVLAA